MKVDRYRYILYPLCVAMLVVVQSCGEECHWADRDTVESSFFAVEITQQNIYPVQPDNIWPMHYSEESTQWKEASKLATDPRGFSGVLFGGFVFILDEPYCVRHQDVPDRCAEVVFSMILVGSKNKGETYTPLHIPDDIEQIDTSTPGVYFSWKEFPSWGGEFQEFYSISVTGDVEILSDKQFSMKFDLEFEDSSSSVRIVSGNNSLEYHHVCSSD